MMEVQLIQVDTLFPSVVVIATYFKPLHQNMGHPFTVKGHEPLPYQELNYEIQTKSSGIPLSYTKYRLFFTKATVGLPPFSLLLAF